MRQVVWLLLFVTGCMRGCNTPSCNGGGGGGPVRDLRCTSDLDCEEGERCHERLCKDPAWVKVSERCLDTPECKAYGACRPGLTLSFLGLSSQPTCLVERTEDCAASKLCKDDGRCTLRPEPNTQRGGSCIATSAEACARSTRCATHDECQLEAADSVCKRAWEGCSQDPPIPTFEDAMELGSPWQPGELADAVIACRLEDTYKQTSSYVRAGGTCRRGPSLGSNTPMLFRTKLAPKDRVEVAIQADPLHGTYRNAGYVRAEYTGDSVFTSGPELPRLTCTVVPPQAARANAAGMVKRLEAGFVRLANQPASPDHLISEPAEAFGIRRVMKEAIVWLGDDPAVARLQASLEAGLVGWRKKLDAAIGRLAPSATGPLGETVRFEGFVCGDELAQRTKQPGLANDACGIEISVTAKVKMKVGASFSDLRSFELARRGPEATVVPADVIDVRPRTSTPVNSVTLEPGEEAIVLVVPRRFIPLAGTRLVGGSRKPRVVLLLDR